ncbi:MAG: TRAP transporter fused permease subunit [Alphaproteobacteria bacterium]|nr:TRAP transporter fused permease subunit [Alphaproteobacteria bacterium]
MPEEKASKDAVSDEALRKAAEFVAAEEGVANRLRGLLGAAVTAFAVGVSLLHLYAAYDIIQTQVLRPVHVACILVLTFCLFPLARRFRDRIMPWDWAMAAAAVAIVVYMIRGGDDFTDRASLPNDTDVLIGIVFILLVLEATRRTSGWIMPAVAVAFILYAVFGPSLPAPWTHRGYGIDRLVGHLYMTLEGIFGTAVDVSSTLIILFTIYGAFLQQSGAGKFFIDFSFAAMGGKPSSSGRTVVMASFLLGGPSGSGVATTVTLGSVAWPMLKKIGYPGDAAGGLLAAGGLGAILSPPVLGAAAFLIAEFLKISYLDVIRMAVIPTILYYLALLVMVEFDVRQYARGADDPATATSLGEISRRYWFHFLSLVAIIGFMLAGFSATMAVFWSTVISFATSFLRRDTSIIPSKLVRALADGSIGVLNAATTCAAAGIIVGVVTLTGLGLKFSSIAIDLAGGSLVLTAVYTALIVWIVGLAVPVTASYIICAVIAAPALIKLGVPDFAAHMFIFYYAVLSEVSPPTALSPFAAAAITGADPYRTTLQSWKYTMPAFITPLMFVLDPKGVGLLLTLPKGGDWIDVVWISLVAAAGIAAFAGCLKRRFLTSTTRAEQVLLGIAGLLLCFPAPLDALMNLFTSWDVPYPHGIGMALALAVAAIQWPRRGRGAQLAA